MAEEFSNYGGQASFNQALPMMIRLNNIFARIDSLSTMPTLQNPATGVYNYEIIANDLSSAFQTISSKLKPEEKEMMQEKMEIIVNSIMYDSPNKIQYDYCNKPKKAFYPQLWFNLNKLFMDFRLELERLQEAHGLGNPSKYDPTKSAVNM